MDELSFNVDIDMDMLFSYIGDLIQFAWPVIALGLGISLAGFLLGIISQVFIAWVRDR